MKPEWCMFVCACIRACVYVCMHVRERETDSKAYFDANPSLPSLMGYEIIISGLSLAINNKQ